MSTDFTPPPDDLDVSTPHSARIWNYWLGGKDNFEADRAAGDATAAVYPEILTLAREARAFLGRVVRYLVGEAGVRQFVDIGTGLPTADNTHQVAQQVAPDARIVYVDNDPLVLAHARALLISTTPAGWVDYVHQDMNDPESLVSAIESRLDLTQPVAVLFMGVLGHVQALADAQRIVRTVMDAVPPGSYLALQDGTSVSGGIEKAEEEYAATGAVPYIVRRPAEIESLFDGLEWVEPGFVSIPLWRPAATDGLRVIGGEIKPIDAFGGVARKP